MREVSSYETQLWLHSRKHGAAKHICKEGVLILRKSTIGQTKNVGRDSLLGNGRYELISLF